MPRILFYVQYLEGIGHVVRAKRIVEELCRRGFTVTLVLGGHPISDFTAAGATVQQLPPLNASPTSYSLLLKPDGTPVDDDYKRARCDQLMATFETLKPHIIITEAYPMGRWAMDFELFPLLERAHTKSPRPLIITSCRDILQMPKKREKSDRSISRFEQFYDHMLIHGDPTFMTIEESFPPIAPLLHRATYTGLVVPEPPAPLGNDQTHFEVLVSGGGGAIAFDVLKHAMQAKAKTALSAARWLALTGPRMPEEQFRKLQTIAKDNDVRLERYMPDLAALMAGARLSVQRAGYNTIADLLMARCRGVLVPDADNNQMEQPRRAERLASLGHAVVVREDQLTTEAMAHAMDQALQLQPPDLNLDVNGAQHSADVIAELWKVHHQPPHLNA